MKKSQGFTLVEMIVFIVIMGIVGATILLASTTILSKQPALHNQTIATQSAARCLEWYWSQRSINGFDSIIAPSNTLPNICRVPSGFTITTNVINTTLAPDIVPRYKTITVMVTGAASATMSLLIASY